jgi:NTE family protein
VEKVSGLINIAERTFMLSMSKEIIEKAKKFDLLVAPPELRNYKILDPEKADELFSIGYKATKAKLKEIDIDKLLE